MENNKIGLGDLLNEILGKLQFEIKDLALMESLNDTKLERTEGLKLIYPKQEVVYSIPKVSAQDILEKVELKEELFTKFWDMYNKKTGTKDAKIKFLKLSDKDIDNIFKTYLIILNQLLILSLENTLLPTLINVHGKMKNTCQEK